MLATFCLRLACGMAGTLLILSPAQVNPRFYRVQFLAILGLTAAAAFLVRQAVGPAEWMVFCLTMLLAIIGSLVWTLEGAPAGRAVIPLTFAGTLLALALATTELHDFSEGNSPGRLWLLIDEFTSAALLGGTFTAMLMGHSYLVAPAMSISPLLRLLAFFSVTALLRILVASTGLWFWTREHSLANLQDETVLWLPVRWFVGFVGPLLLGWMAWQAAKIRSTQSATGILYVVVILCFLGELTGQLLLRSTGYIL